MKLLCGAVCIITQQRKNGFMRPKHVIFESKTLLVSGEAMLCRGEVFLVKGSVPHSVWSNCDSETVMIGISVK